jgi:hypothetical protein
MIVDFHVHLWGSNFIPAEFYYDDAKKWAEKSPDRRPEMILPKILKGIEDIDAKMFLGDMDKFGVDIITQLSGLTKARRYMV